VEAVQEGVKVAVAEGIRLEPYDLFDPRPFLPYSREGREGMYKVFHDLALKDRRNLKPKSGIWRDMAVRKRKTEIPWLTGYVVERGKALGIPTPINEAAVKMISELEEGARSMSWKNLDKLNQLVKYR
jgi:2-dehydropantoate 2-reductase